MSSKTLENWAHSESGVDSTGLADGMIPLEAPGRARQGLHVRDDLHRGQVSGRLRRDLSQHAPGLRQVGDLQKE